MPTKKERRGAKRASRRRAWGLSKRGTPIPARIGRIAPKGDIMATESFKASRWTRGNLFFPTILEINETAVIRKKRSWFSRNEMSIHLQKVASVRIQTGLCWSEILIESTGGTDPIASHGHRKKNALRVKARKWFQRFLGTRAKVVPEVSGNARAARSFPRPPSPPHRAGQARIEVTSAGTRWGRPRLVVETDLSPHESGAQTRSPRPSRRARACGGDRRKGFSDRKYPYRFAYAPTNTAAGGPVSEPGTAWDNAETPHFTRIFL